MKKFVLAVAMTVAAFSGANGALAAGGDNRPVVGVAEFTNQSGAAWWHGGVGWELSGMLSNELSSSGAFRVVERQKLQSVLEEQNLAASGRVAKGTGAKIGKVTGAQYLITGTVTAFEENTSSTGGGLSFKGIGFGGKSAEAYLAVDVRVINTEEVRIARYHRFTAGRPLKFPCFAAPDHPEDYPGQRVQVNEFGWDAPHRAPRSISWTE